MAKNATDTNTLMAAQPSLNVKGGQTVHVQLVFDGLAFSPANLFNALKVQYGAAKVSSDRDAPARGTYSFRIVP